MRRRGLQIVAVCLTSIIFFLGFWPISYAGTRPVRLDRLDDYLNGPEIGSDWIEKLDGAGDKVVVIAKMPEQDTDWITNDLKE